eukprot:gnl/MRDRNA2_/MRDRNA2_85006_c0_seq4.p1 gnl/MRDRNA2_/MRDRNA2_85006_c0~~gnl/MRDRNA2_/MRDRNA2_85006_c0_seq4.p1  ORF type:complete len:108 (+),score=1.45 gnl/MRDRNA2_/MRDRNA2_85006_c0_seq4:186-509(+)
MPESSESSLVAPNRVAQTVGRVCSGYEIMFRSWPVSCHRTVLVKLLAIIGLLRAIAFQACATPTLQQRKAMTPSVSNSTNDESIVVGICLGIWVWPSYISDITRAKE